MRPQWWTKDCELVLWFVRRYRRRHGIQVGTPIPLLWEESESGFYLFAVLTHTPEFEGGWNYLADPFERDWVLKRVEFELTKDA